MSFLQFEDNAQPTHIAYRLLFQIFQRVAKIQKNLIHICEQKIKKREGRDTSCMVIAKACNIIALAQNQKIDG